MLYQPTKITEATSSAKFDYDIESVFINTGVNANIEKGVQCNATFQFSHDFDYKEAFVELHFELPDANKDYDAEGEEVMTLLQVIDESAKLELTEEHYKNALENFVMPDPKSPTKVACSNIAKDKNYNALFFSNEQFNKIISCIDTLNDILSFNSNIYLKAVANDDIAITSGEPDKDKTKITKIKRNVVKVYRQKFSDDDYYLTHHLPVMTRAAFDILKTYSDIYKAGLEPAIFPLGFQLVQIEKKFDGKKLVIDRGKNCLKLVDNATSQQSCILDWSQDLYSGQQAKHKKNLEDNVSTALYIKALFTIDVTEFGIIENKTSDGEKKDFIGHLLVLARQVKYFGDSQSPKNVALNAEITEYLNAYQALVDDKKDAHEEAIAAHKLKFAAAVFNTMDKSNFVQISRALEGFFIAFDAMTDFIDELEKVRFYDILVDQLVAGNKLALPGIRGVAQIEMFKLMNILNKAAAQGPQLLELQLKLIGHKEAARGSTLPSLKLHGTYRPHQNCYDDAGWSNMKYSITEPYMQQNAITLKPQSYDKTKILGLLSNKIANRSIIYNAENIGDKIAIYQSVKSYLLRLDELTKEGIDPYFKENFINLCDIFLGRPFPFKNSTFEDILFWLEGIARKNSQENRVALRNLGTGAIDIGDDPCFAIEKLIAIPHNFYNQFSFSIKQDVKKSEDEIHNNYCDLYNNLKKSESSKSILNRTFIIDFSTSITPENNIQVMAISGKTSNLRDAQGINKDLIRYLRIWTLEERNIFAIINNEQLSSIDSSLKDYLKVFQKKFINFNKSDQSSGEEDFLDYCHQEESETSVDYSSCIVNTRFLSAIALLNIDNLSDDIESKLAHVIDNLNIWLDSLNPVINNSSFEKVKYDQLIDELENTQNHDDKLEILKQFLDCQFIKAKSDEIIKEFEGEINLKVLKRKLLEELPVGRFKKIEYQVFAKRLENINNLQKQIEIFKELFPHLRNYNTQEFSLENTLGDYPDPISEEVSSIKPMPCLDLFLKQVGNLGKGISSQITSKLLFNSVNLFIRNYLKNRKITQVKNNEFFDITIDQIGGINKFLEPICHSYFGFADIASLRPRARDSESELESHINYLIPIIEKYGNDRSIIEIFLQLKEIYGPDQQDLLVQIQSYAKIFIDGDYQQYPSQNKLREASLENFYREIIASIGSARDEEYIRLIHIHLNEILEFGVESQEFDDHNFSDVMRISLSLLKKLHDEDKAKEFVILFGKIKQINITRANSLIWQSAEPFITDEDDADWLGELNGFINQYGSDKKSNISKKSTPVKWELEDIGSQIKGLGSEYSLELLKNDIESVYEKLNDPDGSLKDEEQQCQLGVIARIVGALYRATSNRARTDQIAVLLISIKTSGNIFNLIPTGGGKTYIIAMVAAYNALNDIKTDISTATQELAARDAENMKPFYDLLGIKANADPVTQKNTKFITYEKNLINYGTLPNLVTCRRSYQQSDDERIRKRMFELDKIALIADEGDAERDNPTLIKLSEPYKFKGIDDTEKCFVSMLKLMINFVRGAKDMDGSPVYHYGVKDDQNQSIDKENFKVFVTYLKDELGQDHDGDTNDDPIDTSDIDLKTLENIGKIIDKFSSQEIYRFLMNAHQGEEYLNNWKIGEDYYEIPYYRVVYNSDNKPTQMVKILNIEPIVNGKHSRESSNLKLGWGLQQIFAILKNNAIKLSLKPGEKQSKFYHVDPLSQTISVDSPGNITHGYEGGFYEKCVFFSGTKGHSGNPVQLIKYPPRRNNGDLSLFFESQHINPKNLSRAFYDQYLLLADGTDENAADEKKVMCLVKIIKNSIGDDGRSDPFLILCNNDQDISKYYKIIKDQLAGDDELNEAVRGLQTLGLGAVKTLDSTRGWISKDNENYHDVKAKLRLKNIDDNHKSFSDKVLRQASLPGVLTLATVGNYCRGIDIKNHGRNLVVIPFGCDPEVINTSSMEQALRRTDGRFEDGKAGAILTRYELRKGLLELGIDIPIKEIIPNHLAYLLQMVDQKNRQKQERERVFNDVWEAFQRDIINKLIGYDRELVKSLIHKLYIQLSTEWGSSSNNYDHQTFYHKAQGILVDIINKDRRLAKIFADKSAERYTFERELRSAAAVELLLLKPIDRGASTKIFKLLSGAMTGANAYMFKIVKFLNFTLHLVLKNTFSKNEPSIESEILKFVATIIVVKIINCHKNNLLKNIVINGLAITALEYFSQNEQLSNKREQLLVWNYDKEIVLSSMAAFAISGVLSTITYASLNYSITCILSSVSFMNNNSLIAKFSETTIFYISNLFILVIEVEAKNFFQAKLLNKLDLKAQYAKDSAIYPDSLISQRS